MSYQQVPELEFQDFISTAEQDLIAGKIPTTQIPIEPEPTQEPQPQKPQTSAFWTLEFYKHYYQINTSDIYQRLIANLLLQDFGFVFENPDLWGPFWIPTTLVMILFATSTMASSIQSVWSGKAYKIDVTLLSVGGSTVYGFCFLLPFLLYWVCIYTGSKPTLVNLVNIYGYGVTLWILVALLSLLPFEIIRWTIVAAGILHTTYFHAQALQSHLQLQNTSVLWIYCLLTQTGLGLVFKFYFYTFVVKIN
ncbi:hypothetical protein EDD86DRAFT_225438 [Gorgonomyces haynaldii]|nr:hypothetical protein EDD86DRAFT_225438 [Gorgonomyces haynaldii]